MLQPPVRRLGFSVLHRGSSSTSIRCASALPQIPGLVLTNQEIPSDRLINQIRTWAKSSETLSSQGFDLLQLAERVDGRLAPRAVCGLLRTHLRLPETEEPVSAVVGLFYRARDHLNREFWEDQARKLCDIVAGECLKGSRGIQLLVHHNAPKWAMGLEIGNHRLLSELGVLHIVGRPRGRARAEQDPEFLGGSSSDSSSDAVSVHKGFHQFADVVRTESSVEPTHVGSVRTGWYVLRDDNGEVACGLRVLGSLPLRLVCSSAWVRPGEGARFGGLVAALQRLAKRPVCSLVADTRDPHWLGLCSEEFQDVFGFWRRERKLGVAVTGVPQGLTAEEQVRFARAPFLVPWEFLPFHSGRVVFT